MSSRLGALLATFDPELPLDRARTIPASWYSDVEMYELERRTVFGDTWQVVGRADAVAEPGSFLTADVAGVPILVVRDGAGVLRAFYNVCRHRAAPLITQPEGKASRLRCRYHGWTYDLAGRLRGTPEFEGVADFCREDNGLAELAVAVWCATYLILAVFWGLTWRGIRLPANTRCPSASGAPWSHVDPVFGATSTTKPSPPGYCSGLGPSRYACHPRPMNGYPGPSAPRYSRPSAMRVASASACLQCRYRRWPWQSQDRSAPARLTRYGGSKPLSLKFQPDRSPPGRGSTGSARRLSLFRSARPSERRTALWLESQKARRGKGTRFTFRLFRVTPWT
jgi:nitrite reductase/ring-hydroxylating ferredoxin subunit